MLGNRSFCACSDVCTSTLERVVDTGSKNQVELMRRPWWLSCQLCSLTTTSKCLPKLTAITCCQEVITALCELFVVNECLAQCRQFPQLIALSVRNLLLAIGAATKLGSHSCCSKNKLVETLVMVTNLFKAVKFH